MCSEKKDPQRLWTVCFYLIAAIIFVLAIRLRLKDIATVPGWFRDEGNYYAVCQTLATTGKPSLGPLNITFCSPFMTHPPFYFYTGSAWLSLFGLSFTSLRLFNVLLSLLTLVILFIFCWRHLGRITALLASGLFALYHDIIVFNRMIFPYNLYMLFALIIFFLVVEYLQRSESHFILTASIITAFAGITVYYAIWLGFFLLIAIVWQRKWSHLFYLGIVPVPLLLFLTYHILNNTPGFYEDFRALKNAARAGTLLQITSHYKDFFLISLLAAWGSIGLLFITSRKLRWLAILFLFIVISPVLFKADTIIKFVSYPVIPVLPILTIGMGSFLLLFIRAFSGERLIMRLFSYLLVAGLFLFTILDSREQTPLSFAMVRNPHHAYAMAEFVNTHIHTDELVLASYNVWHLLNTTRKADLPIALAFNGIESDFYLYKLSKSRFAYDTSVDRAKFAVLDFLTAQMMQAPPQTIHYPVRLAIEKIQTQWRLIWRRGEFRVYQNPAFSGDSINHTSPNS